MNRWLAVVTLVLLVLICAVSLRSALTPAHSDNSAVMVAQSPWPIPRVASQTQSPWPIPRVATQSPWPIPR